MGWEHKLKAEIQEVVELKMLDGAEEKLGGFIDNTVDYSPTLGDSKAGYATGEFLNNWKIGLSVQSGYTTEPNPNNSERKDELRKQLAEVIKEFSLSKSIYLYNNSPYAFRVEYLGWGKTSAYAPVARAVSEFD